MLLEAYRDSLNLLQFLIIVPSERVQSRSRTGQLGQFTGKSPRLEFHLVALEMISKKRTCAQHGALYTKYTVGAVKAGFGIEQNGVRSARFS
jgi:hypothetical protein